MRRGLVMAVLAILVGVGPSRGADVYVVDKAHANIGFEVSHLVISKVRGRFNEFSASLTLDEQGKLAGAEATVQVKSIDTANQRRDQHLLGADFFDAAAHPEMTFKSTRVETRDGRQVLVGKLTIRGTTRDVALPFRILGPITDPSGSTKIGFEASGKIDRTDYGLTWHRALEAGGAVVGTEVEIHVNFEATKQ